MLKRKTETLSNKEKFIQAHKVARQTVDQVGNYSIAFKLALVEINEKELKLANQLKKVIA